MAKKTVHVRRNKDGTVTVRVGRQVEHFSAHLSKAELWDAVRVSVHSKDVGVDDVTLTEILREAT